MAFSLYVIVVANIAIIQAQRMAVHGNVNMATVQSELPGVLGGAAGMIGENPSEGCLPPPVVTDSSTMSDEDANDDVQQAINAMRAVQPSLIFSFGLSLFTFILAAVAMVWIKTSWLHLRSGYVVNPLAQLLSCIFLALLCALAGVILWMFGLFRVRKYHAGNLEALTPYLSSLRQPFLGTPPRGSPLARPAPARV